MKSQIYCIILCIWLFSCQDLSKQNKDTSQDTSKNNYSITITIDGTNEGQAFLNIVKSQRLKKMDSVSLTNGHYLFNGKIDEPTLIWLTIDNTTQAFPFILEPYTIEISGEFLHLGQAIVKGGPLNTSYTAFKKESSSFFSKIDTRYQRFQRARLENNSAQLHTIHQEINAVKTDYFQYCIDYVYKNPNSFISLIILNDLIDEKVESTILEDAFTNCSTRIKQHSFAQKIAVRITEL